MEEIVYKIVLRENGGYKTLFNCIGGNRKLETGKWLKAINKLSRDGSGGKTYLTGIHCFRSKEIANRYLSHFRTDKDRVVISCFGKGLRIKPTNKEVFLADEIFIPKMKLEKRYKCWTCKNFSYDLSKKYGHCGWAKQLVILFSWMKNHHNIFIYDTILKPEDECKGYEKGKPTFS